MKTVGPTGFSFWNLAVHAFFLMLCSPALLHGHHDLNSSIQSLTKKIAQKATVDLYYQRGVEYRAIRKIPKAEKDFLAALRLDRKHPPTLAALTRLFSQSGRHKKAIAYGEILTSLSDPSPYLLLLAETYHAAERNVEALATIVRTPRDDASVLLLHAHLVPDRSKSVDILKNGFHRTRNIVLRDSWLDALIAADRGVEVLPIIEKELADSRFRASWLIRRARISLSEGKKAEAHTDLQSALAEIKTRLSPTRPDLTLIHDRGLIHALLGDRIAAEKDLELLKTSSFSSLSYAILTDLLKR